MWDTYLPLLYDFYNYKSHGNLIILYYLKFLSKENEAVLQFSVQNFLETNIFINFKIFTTSIVILLQFSKILQILK